MNALFLHDPHDLDAPIPGGVQICSREFLSIAESAADHLTKLAVRPSSRLIDRINRKLGLRSYSTYYPKAYAERLTETIQQSSISHVFINRCELLRFSELIKKIDRKIVTVVMSHGNQTGDDLYEIAGPGGRKSKGMARINATWRLGLDLSTESSMRHHAVNVVAVMSKEEQVLERWLGAQRVVVLPRLLKKNPLNRNPLSGRIGYVGTLTHTPNRVALERLCHAWSACGDTSKLHLRIVGRGSSVGEKLARRFPFVQYCGALNDQDLVAEASTWSLFLNPIFWLSRGASMKLGQALAWGLPVLSTEAGARGYEWSGGDLPTTPNDEHSFVRLLARLANDPEALAEAGRQCRKVVESGPTQTELAQRLRAAVV